MAMMLAETDMGIGTGHSAVGDQDAVRRILGLPSDCHAAYMLALGYPADGPMKPIREPDRRHYDNVVHQDPLVTTAVTTDDTLDLLGRDRHDLDLIQGNE